MKLLIIVIISALFTAHYSNACPPDKLFQKTGFAWLNGGYENFVGTGTASGKDNQEVRVVFGGGNHASGNLGATFPWSKSAGNRLYGLGFNDMMIKVGNRLFTHERTFEKQPTSELVLKDLILHYNSDDKVYQISMSEIFHEVYSGHDYMVEFVLHVVEGRRIVERGEGFKRFKIKALKKLGKYIKKYFGINIDQAPGLNLSERALVLDSDQYSRITVTSLDGKTSEEYKIDSFFGGLEKSEIHIYAAREPDLRAHMKYDYIGLYPESPECGNYGIVAYISGILNHEQTPKNPLWSWLWRDVPFLPQIKLPTLQSLMHDFALKKGSSGFFMTADGDDVPIDNIHQYVKLESISDIAEIDVLRFTTRKGKEYPELTHKLGPGTFHRKLIEIMRVDGCKFYGMLETQTLN